MIDALITIYKRDLEKLKNEIAAFQSEKTSGKLLVIPQIPQVI